ncbi:MSS4 [Ecytonucleospora hepatopenaei]|uniref:MSS4 n=1 Tax=Ecytonucleospora hepatopenaei TaxID=646526 RepID=A0A1W0E3G3_9MICR|nr:MSS4 [Ecytonucleospora hepatopenaei]
MNNTNLYNENIEMNDILECYETEKLSEDKVYEIKSILEAIKILTDKDNYEKTNVFAFKDITNTENKKTLDNDVEMNDIIFDEENALKEPKRTFQEEKLKCEKSHDDEIFISSLLKVRMHHTKMLKTKEKISLTNTSFIFNKNIKGKSNSTIFFDCQFKYCFKQIRKNEFLKYNMEIEKIEEYIKACPKTLLAQIFGVFTIEINNTEIYLIAMKNVLNEKYEEIFDLKGLDVVRGANEGIKLKITEKIKVGQNTIDQMICDVNFLSQLGVMDYSIIIGRNKTKKDDHNTISIGIVDTLTEYGFSKKMERLYSLVFCESTGSSTNPVDYANRVIKLIKDRFEAI